MTLVQAPDGTLTGNGGYPAGDEPPYPSPYNWTLEGEVDGDTVMMTIDYENSYTATISGSYDHDTGQMSGGPGTGGVTDWVATPVE